MKDSQLITASQLVADLRALGLRSGDLVMVHASLRSVGRVLGGPDVLIGALLTALGPQGTVMAYTDWQDGVQHLTRKDAPEPIDLTLLEELPPFNPATSRTRRAYGVLPEFLRTFPGAWRSANPDAFVCAVGAQAEWLCADHLLQYGYGPGSPLAKLVQANGRVLLLGSPLDSVTLLHYSEHMAQVPGKRVIHYREPILIDGKKRWVEIDEYDTGNSIVSAAPEGYFAEIVQAYLRAGQGRSGMIGNANSHLLDAQGLHSCAVDWIEKNYAGG